MAYNRTYQDELEEAVINGIGYEELYASLSMFFSADQMCEALESIAADYEISID